MHDPDDFGMLSNHAIEDQIITDHKHPSLRINLRTRGPQTRMFSERVHPLSDPVEQTIRGRDIVDGDV